MKLLAALISLLSLASSSLATIAFTDPVAATSIAAGTPHTLKWGDDGAVPTLATFGEATFSICIGGTVQEIVLATLGSANVGTTSSLSVTIPQTVGPSQAGVYFIRVDSTTVDPTSTFGGVYQGFSAKFTLTGATGTFNATESAIATNGNTAAGAVAATGVTTAVMTLPAAVTTPASSATAKNAAASSSSRSTITSTIGAKNTTGDATSLLKNGMGVWGLIGSVALSALLA